MESYKGAWRRWCVSSNSARGREHSVPGSCACPPPQPSLHPATSRARPRAQWQRLIFDRIMSAQQHDPDAPCTPELGGESGSARRRRGGASSSRECLQLCCRRRSWRRAAAGNCKKLLFLFFFVSNLDFFSLSFFSFLENFGVLPLSRAQAEAEWRGRDDPGKRASAPRICCAQIEASCFPSPWTFPPAHFVSRVMPASGFINAASESLRREQASDEQTRGVALLSACWEILLCCDILPSWDVYSSVVSFRGNGDIWLPHFCLSHLL